MRCNFNPLAFLCNDSLWDKTSALQNNNKGSHVATKFLRDIQTCATMSKVLLTYKEHHKQLPRLVCYDNNFFQAEAATNNAETKVTIIEPPHFSSKNRRATNWVCLNCVSRLYKEYWWHMAYALVIFFNRPDGPLPAWCHVKERRQYSA